MTGDPRGLAWALAKYQLEELYSSIADQATLPESSYKEEELFMVEGPSKRKTRAQWEIDEGIAAVSFNKQIGLNIKQKSLWEVDAKGFLSVSFKQELRVEMVELL